MTLAMGSAPIRTRTAKRTDVVDTVYTLVSVTPEKKDGDPYYKFTMQAQNVYSDSTMSEPWFTGQQFAAGPKIPTVTQQDDDVASLQAMVLLSKRLSHIAGEIAKYASAELSAMGAKTATAPTAAPVKTASAPIAAAPRPAPTATVPTGPAVMSSF